MLNATFSGRANRSQHSFVVNQLGEEIVSGTYASGTLLPGDVELAERFGVSRTVLREAMKTLTAKGMIIPKARIGTRVTERANWNLFDADVLVWHIEAGVDATFLKHLTDMRFAIEPFAARLAASRASKKEIELLYSYADKMSSADSDESFALADLEFHLALHGASGNPFMLSVGNLIEAALVTSFKMSSPYGEPGRHVATANRHRMIVEAIERGDGEAASVAMERVIHEGFDRIMKKLG
ncbi:MAG: FadR/GntR family transcriptional regulator [Hoeflea sp.]|uniref:FadR/GntR family transcriptional regulator n=1 Tax=Hoeflea sp. TaxID=1940281 RepID=UPI002730E6C5|nr:FadR/GntR family transcriptional regulator [Hoeflea sp.]MDP2122682.1 FadR/GntR family transcriptional regulator [Hoeflea sp.]MDP3526259.1 FadR/GntR family transcriptional regulator [Hoeflea sp.]MDZ7603221.1 FadR/GntR family transcriptional regulator [Hoeflea sp.]